MSSFFVYEVLGFELKPFVFSLVKTGSFRATKSLIVMIEFLITLELSQLLGAMVAVVGLGLAVLALLFVINKIRMRGVVCEFVDASITEERDKRRVSVSVKTRGQVLQNAICSFWIKEQMGTKLAGANWITAFFDRKEVAYSSSESSEAETTFEFTIPDRLIGGLRSQSASEIANLSVVTDIVIFATVMVCTSKGTVFRRVILKKP